MPNIESNFNLARAFRGSVGLLLLMVAGGWLRFYMIGAKTVWLDEAFSIWMANHSPWALWGWLIQIDQHPPLYYTLLSFWQWLFGDLQGVVRAFSALMSLLAIPLFYAGARQLTDRWTGLLAAYLLTVSPFHIHFAQEARMYSLLTLAVAAAFYCLTLILTAEKKSDQAVHKFPRWPWIGYAVAQAGVMLTHNTALVYFTVAVNLVVGSLWLFCWQTGRGSTFPGLNASGFGKRWLQFQGLALLIWLPWAIPFVIQSLGVDQHFWISAPTWDTVRNTQRTFNFMFLPDWVPWQNHWRDLYLVLALCGLIHLRRSPARIWLLLALLFVPIGLALLVSLRRPIYYDRTLIWASLPYYLLMAGGIRRLGLMLADWIPWRLNRRGKEAPGPEQPEQGWRQVRAVEVLVPIGLVLTMTVLNLLSLRGYYFWFEKEEWDKAASYVAEQVGGDDLLLFNATWVQIPFDYYYRHNHLHTAMHGAPVDLFDGGELEPRMATSDVPALSDLIQPYQRVWLVYSHDWYTDPEQIIPMTLSQSMTKQDEQTFIGLKIMRFDIK